MFDLLFSPQNFIFGVAIMLMLLLFVVEVLALLFGGGNDWLDGLLPESLTEVHAEVGIDGAMHGVDTGIFIRFLSWLYVGKVPILMLIVLFLAIFGLSGFLLQSIIFTILGFYLPTVFAVIIAWCISLPLLRASAKVLHKVLPKDETTAINMDHLIGRTGIIVIGTATTDKPAQVKVKDTYGQTHYIMAYSDGADITQGNTVLLVAKDDMYFKVIKNENEMMVD